MVQKWATGAFLRLRGKGDSGFQLNKLGYSNASKNNTKCWTKYEGVALLY